MHEGPARMNELKRWKRDRRLLIPVTHDPGVQKEFGAGKGPGRERKAGGYVFIRAREEKDKKK